MALSRFVLTSTVTVTPDTLATPVAGSPGTGGAAGFGNSARVAAGAGSQGKYGLPGMPLTFLAGTTIYADSTAGFATAPQLLYQAIGAGNLRAYVQGQDDRGGAALGNLSVHSSKRR
jgi:hypothetical protein